MHARAGEGRSQLPCQGQGLSRGPRSHVPGAMCPASDTGPPPDSVLYGRTRSRPSSTCLRAAKCLGGPGGGAGGGPGGGSGAGRPCLCNIHRAAMFPNTSFSLEERRGAHGAGWGSRRVGSGRTKEAPPCPSACRVGSEGAETPLGPEGASAHELPYAWSWDLVALF